MSFDQVFAALDNMRTLVYQGAVAGLDQGASGLEAAAEANARAKINGVTGATHAGIVAYVAGEGVDSSGVIASAIAEVEDRNPAHVLVQDVGTVGDGELAVVLTVYTDYGHILENGVAGDKAFLGPTMDEQAEQLTAAAAAGIAQVLK